MQNPSEIALPPCVEPPTVAVSPTVAAQTAWRSGDGFAALYASFGPRLFRFCLRLTGGKIAEAEDLTQDVFVAAWQKPDWAGRAQLTTYLFKIAVYRHQAQNRRPAMDALSPQHEQTLPVPGASLAQAQTDRLSLEAALQKLSLVEREAFLLVKSEGLTTKEAAHILDVPQGTVKYRVFSAIKKLQTLLTEGDGGALRTTAPPSATASPIAVSAAIPGELPQKDAAL